MDPKDNFIWYKTSDRYSVDFDSVLGRFDLFIKNTEDQGAKEFLALVKEQFNSQFQAIKGEHILHQMGLTENETLKNIPPNPDAFPALDVEKAIQNNVFDYDLKPIQINNEPKMEIKVAGRTILDIVFFLYQSNKEKGNSQGEVFFQMMGKYFENTFNEIFYYDSKIRQQLSETNPKPLELESF